MINFFKKEEEARIVAAIKEAEHRTSGEIRVHLTKRYWGNILSAAARRFRKLKMDKTEQRNGVLLFLVPSRKEFAILGDEGINEKVPEHFGEDVRDLMEKYFQEEKYEEGVCRGIHLIGQKLKAYFPWQEDDKNELSDDISYA